MVVRNDTHNSLCSLCVLYHLTYQLQFLFNLCIFNSECAQSFSCFKPMSQNAAYLTSVYVTKKIPAATENWPVQRRLPLKTHFSGRQACLSLSASVSPILNYVCVGWRFMMHVLTFSLQHLSSMTLLSLMMTPYNSQVRVILTLNIIQL